MAAASQLLLKTTSSYQSKLYAFCWVTVWSLACWFAKRRDMSVASQATHEHDHRKLGATSTAALQCAVLHPGLQEGVQHLQLLPLQPRHHMASAVSDDYRLLEQLRQLERVLHRAQESARSRACHAAHGRIQSIRVGQPRDPQSITVGWHRDHRII